MTKKTLFISDLHLNEAHPASYQLFTQWVDSIDPNVDAIYILGDLFEAWIGDDDQSEFNQAVIKQLKSITTQTIPIFIMPGNRDFLLGHRFMVETGCQLLIDPTVIDLYGQPVLLMHGDTLCTRDLAYQRARPFLRSRLLQRLFTLLPLSVRKKMATRIRQRSYQHVTTSALDIMDVTHQAVIDEMKAHQVNTLIHGHTHRLGMHTFKLDGQDALRIVLGDWHQRGSMLVWTEQGEKELVEI